jgi:DNA replicative helicase MCM subunit Mcm2 (Cdc46/Mcm family)
VLEVNTLVSSKFKDCKHCGEKFVVVETVYNTETLPNFCSDLCEARYNYGKISK